MKTTSRKSIHQHNTGHWISAANRLACYLRDGFACAYCGKDLHGEKPSDVTLDHLVCQSKGGTDDFNNIVTSCRSCNCSRQDKNWREYATGGAIERIVNLRRRSMTRYIKLAKAIIKGEVGDPRIERK